MKKINIRSVEFDVSGACNLDCKYCYFKPQRKNNFGNSTFMTESIVNQFFDSFSKYLNNDKPIKVSFWGGEPLLNFSIIKYIIEKFNMIFTDEAENLNYLIVTNGTLINEGIAKYCKKNNIRLQLTIDSSKECHNAQRPYKSGKGTYERILKSIAILNNNNNDFYVRTTLTADTKLPSEIIADYKAKQIKDVLFSPVFLTPDCDFLNLFKFDPQKVANDLFDTYVNEKNKDHPIQIQNINRILNQIESSIPHISCGVFLEKIAVKYDGKIFPCHRFVESSEFCIGNIKDGFANKYSNLYYKSLINNKNCKKCELNSIFCGGPCLFDIMNNKDINYIQELNCVFQKELTKNVLKKYIVEKNHPIVSI